MRRLKLSTQIIVIALVCSILVPIFGVVFGAPLYKRTMSKDIFESLNYQLDLNFTDASGYMDSIFYISEDGKLLSYVLRPEDDNIMAEELSKIFHKILSDKSHSGQDFIDLADSSQAYYVFQKADNGNIKIVLKTFLVRDTWFGNENIASFLLMIILFSMLPIMIILIWFAYIGKSIKSIDKSVSEDNLSKPILASKELMHLNDSIEIFKREIHKGMEEKQRLFQNISHELKTPITTIRMYAEGIEDGIYQDGDIKKSTAIIKEETENLLKRVNKIMDINKLYHVETSAINFNNEVVNLSEVIFETLDLYGKRAPHIKFTTTLERYRWNGTKEIWSTILQNIFDNNIKHGATHINIILSATELIVENDGDKIEEEVLEKIFNPFIKGEKGNFGLGLNIIQRALKILGCKIEVANTEIGVKYHIRKRMR